MEYKEYLQSKERKDFAKQFKKDKSCERCWVNKKLVVHHKTYEHIWKEKGNEWDLMVLCIGCHFKEHFGYKKGGEFTIWNQKYQNIEWNFIKMFDVWHILINKLWNKHYCLLHYVINSWLDYEWLVNPFVLLKDWLLGTTSVYKFIKLMGEHNIIKCKEYWKWHYKEYYLNPYIAMRWVKARKDTVNLFKQWYDWTTQLSI